MTTKHFSFRIDIEEVLSVDDIWPDGDAPENPTVEDVQDKFKGPYRGGTVRNAQDWGLLDDLHVEIDEVD
jgi:hypothetical protein